MTSLVFTSAAFELARHRPGKWWRSITNKQPKTDADEIHSASDDNVICYWTSACDPSSSLIVITCPDVFTETSDRNALTAATRIAKVMRVGLLGGRMPPDIGPLRHGNLISVFAYNYAAGMQQIIAEARPLGSEDLYVCQFGLSGGRDLATFVPNRAPYQHARSVALKAIPTAPEELNPRSVTFASAYGNLGASIASKMTWQAWERQLNPEQKKFVDMTFDAPIRLRGSAGTGKTLTLAVKAMKLLNTAKNAKPPRSCKILFLTHSWALAEAIDELMHELDPGHELRQGDQSIDVWPLLTLADLQVRLGSASRRLLGSDSRTGKVEMLNRLNEHLSEYLKGDWITRRSGCRATFVERLEAGEDSPVRKEVLWELINEFATVFAAAGIHPRRRHDYFRLRRKKWMLDLQTQSEKEAIADLYQAYFEGMQADGLTGPEQLVSDYLKALSTFEWDRLRKTEGFDYIFVDEMHLFDEQERYVIHQLLADGNTRPRVAMALDPKQSPLAMFVSHERGQEALDSNEIYKRAKLEGPHKMDLTTSFRNTPEIRAFVQVLIDHLMTPDVNDEWDTPSAEPARHARAGDVPSFQVHESSSKQFKHCFDLASSLSRQGERQRVAVLCMDAERFDAYLVAAGGQYKNEYAVISSQEDLVDPQTYSRKFVVSMPEYVGGLQFDHVFILDVNDNSTSEDVSAFHRAYFLHDLYVGSSRARDHLQIHACNQDGGLSTLLNRAIQLGVLKQWRPKAA